MYLCIFIYVYIHTPTCAHQTYRCVRVHVNSRFACSFFRLSQHLYQCLIIKFVYPCELMTHASITHNTVVITVVSVSQQECDKCARRNCFSFFSLRGVAIGFCVCCVVVL